MATNIGGYAAARSGTGLVAHPVFKTGRPWQPHGWMVRFHRRSVACCLEVGPSGGQRPPARHDRRRLPSMGARLALAVIVLALLPAADAAALALPPTLGH